MRREGNARRSTYDDVKRSLVLADILETAETNANPGADWQPQGKDEEVHSEDRYHQGEVYLTNFGDTTPDK